VDGWQQLEWLASPRQLDIDDHDDDGRVASPPRLRPAVS